MHFFTHTPMRATCPTSKKSRDRNFEWLPKEAILPRDIVCVVHSIHIFLSHISASTWFFVLFSREPSVYEWVCPSIGRSVRPSVRNDDGERLMPCIRHCFSSPFPLPLFSLLLFFSLFPLSIYNLFVPPFRSTSASNILSKWRRP